MIGAVLRPFGDRGTLVEVGGPAAALAARGALADALPDVEVVAGWSSVLVIAPGLDDAISAVLERVEEPVGLSPVGPVVEVPVRYDGPDLDAVATIVDASADEVIAWHAASPFVVVMLGFLRGFPYLAGLDPRLAAVGRLGTPRTKVAAGAVAIASGQAGIYPMEAPGGWHVLGHTDLVLFDAASRPPSPFAPGTPVRFIPA